MSARDHRTPRRLRRRLVAGLAGTAVVAAGVAATGPAPASAADATSVTVRVDPSYRGETFEGWGTSLVWFANATGDYPDEIRDRLADLVFGKDGLALNIARYNIGGGNAPDVQDYLRPGGAVEGWWKAPEGTTREDTDWWDPENPDHWNDDADATQRWWVDKIKKDITHWETFSNSPPWFQTVSGYVSGGFNSSDEQLRTDRVDDFTAYVVGATERLERAEGITVDTVDPFNEPNTPYWGTQLGADGEPTGGRQEGAHIGPEVQQQVIRSLAERLEGADTKAKISAMDETNPTTFARNWNSYPEDVRRLVTQLNVHTYGTSGRTAVRDIAKGEKKPLWMSEVEGSWGDRQDFESMEPGLGMATRIVDDLRELEPSAWVFWQPVEDYDNMKPGGESANGANWGSIQLPFDCTAADTLKTCPIYTNTKFDTVRNFTHFVRPGDHLVGVDDTDSVAAVNRRGANVVHVNDETTARDVTLDLSGFDKVKRGATVTPIVTDASGALKKGRKVVVKDERATLRVPAESVTTFEVSGVSGVDREAPLVQPGQTYTLQGAESGLPLAPNGTGGIEIATPAPGAAQQWTLKRVGRETGARAHYTVENVADRSRLVADAQGVRLEQVAQPGPRGKGKGHGPAKPAGPEARWTLSTTGDGTYVLLNEATKQVLDVPEGGKVPGTDVGQWVPNSGDNQRWQITGQKA